MPAEWRWKEGREVVAGPAELCHISQEPHQGHWMPLFPKAHCILPQPTKVVKFSFHRGARDSEWLTVLLKAIWLRSGRGTVQAQTDPIQSQHSVYQVAVSKYILIAYIHLWKKQTIQTKTKEKNNNDNKQLLGNTHNIHRSSENIYWYLCLTLY